MECRDSRRESEKDAEKNQHGKQRRRDAPLSLSVSQSHLFDLAPSCVRPPVSLSQAHARQALCKACDEAELSLRCGAEASGGDGGGGLYVGSLLLRSKLGGILRGEELQACLKLLLRWTCSFDAAEFDERVQMVGRAGLGRVLCLA